MVVIAATFFTALISALLVVNVVRNKEATPHPFTRLIWLLISGIGCAVSWHQVGWNLNTLPLLAITIGCLLIWLIALSRKHEEEIEVHVAMPFIVFLGIVGWVIFEQPLLAALSICVVEVVSTIPTIKNIYRNPKNDIVWYLWAGDSVGLTIGIFAASFDIVALLYPLTIIVMSSLLAVISFARRNVSTTQNKN